ncbi:MAG: YraN family protein [Treponema sp.]|nr:YraN family protein [Treponema sp.]
MKGKLGEDQAVNTLTAAGMTVIERNFRSKSGEVDIIAKDGETIVFVEVKAWSAFGIENLQYGLDIRKQQKIIKTAKYFLSKNREYSNTAVRFDVVFIQGEPPKCRVTHLASAFTESV